MSNFADCEAVQNFQVLMDREAIRDCLTKASMATDLLDIELWKSAYWPEATEDHMWVKGNAHRFIEQTVPALGTSVDTVWHQPGNILIRIEGSTAQVASYCVSYVRIRENETRRDWFVGGRYFDRVEKRGNEWRIADRVAKIDWSREMPDSDDWGRLINNTAMNFGVRGADDPFYELFGTAPAMPPFAIDSSRSRAA